MHERRTLRLPCASRRALAWLSLLLAGAITTAAPSALLRRDIAEGVKRGRAYLYEELRRGRFPHSAYPMGIRCLYLYALLEAGVDPDDPVIEKSFQHIAGLPLRYTYSVSLYLLALERRCTARARCPLLSLGEGPEKLTFLSAERKRAASLLSWLLAAKAAQRAHWTYTQGAGPGYDNSNSQFAVMALEVALRNGLAVPQQVVLQVKETFTGSLKAVPDGERRRTTVEIFNSEGGYLGAGRVRTLNVVPAGWGYTAGGVPTFSMTCAGLSNLAVARRWLSTLGGSRRASELQEPIQQACAWLSLRWDDLARLRPGPQRAMRRYYYTIWSLEKAADLAGVRRFGPHRWYEEESAFLLRDQAADGSWGRDGWEGVATSFALLFLRRASAPLRPFQEVVYVRRNRKERAAKTLVYLRSLEGMVPIGGVLCAAYHNGDSATLSLAREAIEAFPEDRRPELIPTLLALRGGGKAQVRTFAGTALRRITGQPAGRTDTYRRWYQVWSELRRSSDLSVQVRLLREAHTHHWTELQLRALAELQKQKRVEVLEPLVPLLGDPAEQVRRKAYSIFVALSEGLFSGPPPRTEEEGRAAAHRARAFLQAGGARRVARARVERALRRFLAVESPRWDEDALSELAAHKEQALAALKEHLAKPVVAVRLFFLLRYLTGEDHGVDPEAWQPVFQGTQAPRTGTEKDRGTR